MSRNKQLGELLRLRRTRLDPIALGLSVARRRRTPGLRREEVATRAGINCEWYVKLEQGREVWPSSTTVTSLALDAADTAHLLRLVTRTTLQPFERETVSAIVAVIVEGFSEPAYITGAQWDVLAWNAAAEAIFAFDAMCETDRNIPLFMFADLAARALFGESSSSEARRMAALFRVVHDQRADDPTFSALVSWLESASADFRSWWTSHDVDTSSAGLKTPHLANGREAHLDYASFQSYDDPGLKLSLYRRLPRRGLPDRRASTVATSIALRNETSQFSRNSRRSYKRRATEEASASGDVIYNPSENIKAVLIAHPQADHLQQ